MIRRAHHAQIHTGWFIESLATQTLVLLVIRTTGNPFRSKPSLALLATVIVIVLIGALLPFTPLAPRLGFTPSRLDSLCSCWRPRLISYSLRWLSGR